MVADSLLQSAQRPQSAAPVRPPEPVLKQAPAEPGEFTRMFQAPAVAAPPAPPPAPPAPQAKTEVGEFTKMFQAPKAPPAPPARPSSSQGTRRVYAHVPGQPESGSGASASRTNPAPAISSSYSRRAPRQDPCRTAPPCSSLSLRKPPVVPDRIESASLRRLWKGGFDPAPAPPAAAPAPKEPGEFTRMFHSPGARATRAAPPAPPHSPPPPAATPIAAQPSGPGEYTRQFSAPAQLTFGQTSRLQRRPLPALRPYAPPAMAQPAMPNMAQAPHAAEEIEPGVDPRHRRNRHGDRPAGRLLRDASQIATSPAPAES